MVKRRLTTLMLILVFLAGLSLLLYPTVSDYWNKLHQSRAIASYAESVAGIDSKLYDSMLEKAREYNSALSRRRNSFLLNSSQKAEYDSLLDMTGTGVMGYIEIPAINCVLPIYHGTNESVLQVAVGHLEWSSLPVGGENTHCVVSGHRGLPSAKLFTDLDELCEGDVFIIRVLDETLTYQVDRILIVDPSDTKDLLIEAGSDYCTLVTCTPYGINSHRLLVRGHRVENSAEALAVKITSDAVQIDPKIVAPVVALPILIGLGIFVMFGGGKKDDQDDFQ